MRLFAAIVPPDEVLDALAAELERVGQPRERGLRWVPRPQWHLTLAFYGEDDLRSRTEWLAPRLSGCAPVRLHVSGSGTFPGVLWAGVGGDLAGLQILASAAGADGRAEARQGDRAGGGDGNPGRPYHPHLTVARWRAPRRPAAVQLALHRLAAHRGPAWLADAVVLMRSESSPDGSRSYTVEHRFALCGG